MNRSWMNANRLSEEYEKGVEEFLQFALKKLPESKGRFYCPCVICLNENTLHFEEIRSHLICYGIDMNYIRWIWHGDSLNMSNTSEREDANVDMNDQLEHMIRDVGQESFNRAHVYDNLCSDKEEPLYPGCINFTRPHAKVLWYLPIVPRFKRLFANTNDAKSVRWHADERKCDGQLRHPADSLQWKKIDDLYPEFGSEPRNLRLGLATDGMNPYGNLSSNHSSWPVLLVIYNLPPWICMKRKYIMLSMMISGPKQPGNDIDVYLSPLIEDLRMLWEGVDVFDGYSREYFKMRAMLFCTINDFPAYGNLCGYSVKGHKASNVKSLVSMKDLKLVGLKSHDCHILMQQLLPVALRGILPKKVREVLTRLCLFFNAICSKVIDPQKLNELENEAVIILCQLEMYFPPSFFDIMVHLIVHLVREIKLCGPVYLRWMYPFERYMKILKGYVKNPHRPEASIVERYIAEEAIEFCSDYMSKAEAIGIPRSRHEGTCVGNGIRGLKLKSMGREEVLQAHLYILNNTDEVQPYLSTHKSIVKENYPRMNEKWLLNEHNKTFLKWFKETNNTTSDTLKWLANGPHFDVITWTGYDINNFTFYTKSQDDSSTMQNSGVMVVAESMHFSSSKDKNPVTASIPYFGTIEEIWDVDFIKFIVHVFKCKWIDINNGVKIDEFGFTLADLEKVAYKDEPFIMASQAKQVFYVSDPSNKKWSVVLQGTSFHGPNESLDSTLDVFETPPFSQRILTFVEETIVDNEYATRDDHQEGIWENIQT
ncbi:uncharacterized protein [Cicer arietinum]|uniref:uncharacterized protein n=1 Tax=Cicer arietinum TaxID=3827 RepID=UPI003CC5F6E8